MRQGLTVPGGQEPLELFSTIKVGARYQLEQIFSLFLEQPLLFGKSKIKRWFNRQLTSIANN
jgi:hypothetical protein